VRELIVGLALLLALGARLAAAAEPCAVGGSPGITELGVGPFTFPTGVVAAPDGAIWVASTFADQLVRVDPVSLATSVVSLPLRSHPIGLAADTRGRIWFAASGVGLVGRLTPGAARAAEFAPPSLFGDVVVPPFVSAIALGPAGGDAWFTLGPRSTVGSVAIAAEPIRRGSVVNEVSLGAGRGRPDAIAVAGDGAVWVTEIAEDALIRVGPDGRVERRLLPSGSQPRGVAVGPDGGVWVALFGRHELLRLRPGTGRMQTWTMPSGSLSHPWALVIDTAGGVWTSEFTANTLACFDAGRERFTVWPVPTRGAGVRALAVDGRGRVWFVGSYSGRLGLVGPSGPHGTMSAR